MAKVYLLAAFCVLQVLDVVQQPIRSLPTVASRASEGSRPGELFADGLLQIVGGGPLLRQAQGFLNQ
jgi:hypothetical protein